MGGSFEWLHGWRCQWGLDWPLGQGLIATRSTRSDCAPGGWGVRQFEVMRFLRLWPLVVVPMVLGVGASGAGEHCRISVDLESVGRRIDVGRLVGGNVALWYEAGVLEGRAMRRHLQEWKPGILRMPGGSWSDEFFWNGNGVRDGARIDTGKRREGDWAVDYQGYAPGFRLAGVNGELSDFHGNVDVKYLHEFIRQQGAETLVTVNAGTGTPEMAAAWVRWANQRQGYAVRYWEVGNELDGEWELGHFGRDGKAIDAETYARRFVAFSKAMKAVDPDIKVGGPACSSDDLLLVETLIREAGDLLDFVSFHTYPVMAGRRSDAERFAQAEEVDRPVRKIREWVRQYHPGRVGAIEVGVTEWHQQVMETRTTVDLASGLWGCLFVGSLAEAGVDFANQWDCFSVIESGGHGLFGAREELVPRAMFHALSLWRAHMHSEWLTVRGGDESLRVYATRSEEELAVMLINTSREQGRLVALKLGGAVVRGPVAARRFSQREYLWNPQRNAPEWSRPATEIRVEFSEDGGCEVPPFSALVLTFPRQDRPVPELVEEELGQPELAILLPDRAPADLPVEGLVVVRRKGSREPWTGTLAEVALSVEGVARADRSTVRTSEAAGRFVLQPAGPGRATVRVQGGGLQATQSITWTPVAEREEVVWRFSDEASLAGMESSYQLGIDRQVRPNEAVGVVQLTRAEAVPKKNTLLAISALPATLPKARVGGVAGLLGASADLRCADPLASVEIVLQSNHDHWILLDRIPLRELRGAWKTFAMRLSTPSDFAAMPELYALRLQLKTEAPVTGRLYVDNLGFLLR